MPTWPKAAKFKSMNRLSTLFKTGAALVLLLAVLSGCFVTGDHPSAATLLTNFQNQRADFERLLQMFREDTPLGRVAYDFTRPADINAAPVDVPAARLDAYRALFTQLNLSAGIEGYGEKHTVWFIASTQGLSISGSAKGYAYAAQRPDLVVEDIDHYRSEDGRSFTAYQLIEGNWYLYFDYED